MGRSCLRLLAVGAAAAVALAPGAAFADQTAAEPSTVRPGGTTTVSVECATDAGGATASSALFGEVVLSRAIGPGSYRATVRVPSTATAGRYEVTGTCGATTSTSAIVVDTGKGNGPTLIGIALIAAGAALTVLATRFRSRTRA